MREPFTVTFGNKKTTINGLPETQVRYWDKDFKIKLEISVLQNIL